MKLIKLTLLILIPLLCNSSSTTDLRTPTVKAFIDLTPYRQFHLAINDAQCLVVENGAQDDDARIVRGFCSTNGDNSLWREIIRSTAIDRTRVHLQVKHSGKCLVSHVNSRFVSQTSCGEYQVQQLWEIRLQSGNTYQIYSVFADLCLEIEESDPRVYLTECRSNRRQFWEVL